ncbi:hypothetical protein EVAR_29456_1 [Eumeta japonica]|uniref:Uncharacterized protein n=1 Tax=Eumeta variegata TaxID=151549 RepID=A0A4C1WU26_EUMVA|nr:hypothetical protein EVAR_29456_1 [Eumeta japonica]
MVTLKSIRATLTTQLMIGIKTLASTGELQMHRFADVNLNATATKKELLFGNIPKFGKDNEYIHTPDSSTQSSVPVVPPSRSVVFGPVPWTTRLVECVTVCQSSFEPRSELSDSARV